jgi:hypothetical protein
MQNTIYKQINYKFAIYLFHTLCESKLNNQHENLI